MIIDEPEVIRQATPEFQPPPMTSGRLRRFPQQYQDFLPSSTTQIPHMPPKEVIQPPLHSNPHFPNIQSPSQTPEPPQTNVIKTDRDKFGLFRVYTTHPQINLDDTSPNLGGLMAKQSLILPLQTEMDGSNHRSTSGFPMKRLFKLRKWHLSLKYLAYIDRKSVV